MGKDRYDAYDDFEPMPSRKKASNKKRNGRKKKKRSLKAKFFMVLSLVLFVYCVGALGYFGYEYYIEDSLDINSDSNRDKPSILESLVKPTLKERTVFVVMGTDKEGDRTDTIMVCCYNQPLDELTIISIPRDTLVEVSQEDFQKLQEEYPEPGQRGMKINAITHYGLEKYGIPMLISEIEEMVGAEVDYYCLVNFEAFDYLVDSIGGIEYDVPMNMDYDDPSQDLSIHLKAGLQTLNGEQAQGLVRFRSGYANADIGRVSVQQDFCKKLLQQLVSKENFFKNATTYLKTFYKYVQTDLRLSDAIKYMSVVRDFNANNINTYTMPGYVGSDYGIHGAWILDEAEVEKLCYEVFRQPVSEIKAQRALESQSSGEAGEQVLNDKNYTVQVLNGGFTDGMASKVQTKLIESGYNVKSIGTFDGEKADNTRIYVKQSGLGSQIKEHFKDDAKVIVDSNVASNFDIVVVIGITEE